MGISKFEEIEAWQLARELSSRIYALTDSGSLSRDYGLRDQMRRAAVSVMSNIAEGFDGGSHAEFAKFLQYAQRSCTELQSQLYIVCDSHGLSEGEFQSVYAMIQLTHRKIGAFIKYLRNH